MTKTYDLAKAMFADWGVDTEAALASLSGVPISVHCWQGDDVGGFERKSGTSGGGIQATGNHPGRRARPMSCAPIWTLPSRRSPASTG